MIELPSDFGLVVDVIHSWMDREQRRRLENALDGGHWRPFASDDRHAIGRALGREVPAAVSHLWSHFGTGGIPASKISIYDAEEVVDLLEQYTDVGLIGLLPFACDNGSRDFAVDLARRTGLPVGTVLLNDRGVMTERDLRPVAVDVIELVELARAGQLDRDIDEAVRRFEQARLS